MDYRHETIRPRRALHTRVWHFEAFVNVLQSQKQMASVQPMQQRQPEADGAIKYPISVIDQKMAHEDNTHKEKPIVKKPNACKKIMVDAGNAFDEYCDSSTLHGLKYVGDNSLSVPERLYWLTTFIAGLCFAVYFIAMIYQKFDTSPMVISFNPKLALLNEIPFPAITICNVNLALKSKAIPIEQHGDNKRKELLLDLCNYRTTTDQHAGGVEDASDWDTVEAFTIEMNQQCDDLIKVCKWNGNIIPCDDIINSVLTDEGYCCAFNQLPRNMTLRGNFTDRGHFPTKIINWNAEDGYGDADNDIFPFRATGQGQNLGLTLVLDAQLDEYHCTSTNSIGFKLLLSAPNERPKVAEVGFLLAPGDETRITILPELKDATEGVRHIDLEKRACFFARERMLMYFWIYTEKNCRLECLSNFSMGECQCIPYYLPRNPEDAICDRSKDACVQEVQAKISRFSPERKTCNCLPSCHNVNYKVDSMSTGRVEGKYDTVNMDIWNHTNLTTKYFSENVAIAHFYFEVDKYTKQTKSELFGFTEFLSNTGGLLGLFLGFSFLSGVEIIYFIFIRGPSRRYRQNKEQKLKEKQELKTRWASISHAK